MPRHTPPLCKGRCQREALTEGLPAQASCGVIPSQSADWRGNPFPPPLRSVSRKPVRCYTSGGARSRRPTRRPPMNVSVGRGDHTPPSILASHPLSFRRGRCPRSGAKRNKYPWGASPRRFCIVFRADRVVRPSPTSSSPSRQRPAADKRQRAGGAAPHPPP